MVWCQDYHLMLLPALLKARYPKMKVSPAWPLSTGKERKVFAVRRHEGSLCTQKQPGTHQQSIHSMVFMALHVLASAQHGVHMARLVSCSLDLSTHSMGR